MRRLVVTLSSAVGPFIFICGASPLLGGVATQRFDANPNWPGRLNIAPSSEYRTVTQNFGFSNSSNAGGMAGEAGGRIERTTRPAWYADPIPTATFSDILTATGQFSLPTQNTGGAFHFGWFNSLRQGFRPWSAIGFRLDGQGTQSNLHLDYMTAKWRAGGLNVTNSFPTINVPHNGSDQTFWMQYDPLANNGGGALAFRLNNSATITLNLDPGHKFDGATFNRFGLFNQQAPAGAMTVYFDNLTYNDRTQNFNSANNGWEEVGSRTTFTDTERRNAHNFGYRTTNNAGGASAGEMGGIVWRPPPGQEPYYADDITPINLNQTIYAAGRVSLRRANTDGGAYFGFFNDQSIRNPLSNDGTTAAIANFLGVNIEGPSRVGHYFRPVYAVSNGVKRDSGSGPVIFPDNVSQEFSISYDPNASNGLGRIRVTLGGEVRDYTLGSGDRSLGAVFDRFGIFSIAPDGAFIEPFFDDLTYTDSPGDYVGWNTPFGGSWADANNWLGGVPNAVDALARFGSIIVVPRDIQTNAAFTVGSVRFEDPAGYALRGAGSVRLDVSAGAASVVATVGTHTIDVPLSLADATTFDVAMGAAVVLNDPLQLLGGASLAKTGAGTVTALANISAVSTATLSVGSGTLRIAGGVGTPATAIAPATANVVMAVGEATVRIESDANLSELPINPAQSGVQALDLAAGSIRLYPGDRSASEAVLYSAIQFAAGSASGRDGLFSSTLPASGYGIGLTDQSNDAHGDLSVLVRVTLLGDANVNGSVTLDDFTVLASRFGAAGLWDEGNFNGDNTVDLDDFTALAANFGQNALRVSAVPEPAGTMTGFVGWGLLSMSRRTRRIF